MFCRILKKDLKRKKTMNTILFVFIILAAMFVASGLNNVITVINGTDYYLDKAGVGDYNIITMGSEAVSSMDKVLRTTKGVTDYKIETFVVGSKNNVMLEDRTEAETKNAVIFQPVSENKLLYFDSENKSLKEVALGHVYVTGKFLEKNDLEPGDKCILSIEGVELELIIDGKVKDALLGSDFMGNTRFFLNDKDMQKFLDNEKIVKYYRGQIGYVYTYGECEMSSAAARISGIAFDGERSTIKMTYVMDMIVAFVILILSICLIIVSFVILKFSISFTILEEFREIGVMKAIGISNIKIRSLYMGKYLMLSVAGVSVGFFASIPFGNMLLKSVSENMMLGNEMGIIANISGGIIVIILILLFSYHCTKKVKKLSPVDAIRSGQTGERYKKKTVYRIGRSHVGTNFYLALNDVISSPKRFITVIISFFICTLFVLVLVNTTETMESSSLIKTFGTESDLYIENVGESLQSMFFGDKDAFRTFIDEKADKVSENVMPAKACVEVQFKYRVSFKGNDYLLSCQQGVGTKINDYEFSEGTAPQNGTEIAITDRISDMTGAKIGDTVTIDFGENKVDCIVTAYFQTMNQLGEIIRLHEDAPTDFKYVSSIMQTQINFEDSPDDGEIDRRKEKVQALFKDEKVMDAVEYCIDCIGVVDTMKAVQYLLLVITIIVVLLVTILMEHSFIADERSQIAILKAVGFYNRDIVKWHTIRFGLVALISVILAAIVSIPMTKLCISPVFGMMGAGDVKFKIDILKVFIVYPGIVFAVTVFVAFICSLHTGKISCRDTANIE